MISVKVLSKNSGNPIKNQKVCIGFSGFWRGFSSNEYTNQDGEVHFNNDPGEGTIYINGKNSYQGRLAGLKIVYI
ncbi:MAG: hypothetical protein IPL20_03095 [Saprospiraceae bacterium]|nr:hypothetical protein [Saprospiraceae bacterium]